MFYLTADSASGSKFYKLNKSLAQGLPSYSAVDWQQNMPSITDVQVTSDALTFTSYYQDADGSLKQFDAFTLKKASQNAENPGQGGNAGNQGGNTGNTGNQGGTGSTGNQNNTGNQNQGNGQNQNNTGNQNKGNDNNAQANAKKNGAAANKSTTKGGMPQTGDYGIVTMAVIVIAGVLAIAGGVFLYKRRI